MSCNNFDGESRYPNRTSRKDVSQAQVLEEDLVSRSKSREENEIVATEKSSCDRCRQRKIRCDRVSPCSQCIKSGSQCTYKLGQKIKTKRQRILVSSAYESRMEDISNKIDDISAMMKQLSHGPRSVNMDSSRLNPQFHSLHRHYEPRVAGIDENSSSRRHNTTLDKAEGIESTLFAHVIFAARFTQAVVANDPNSNISLEMASALDDLRTIISRQKQQNETMDDSNPFSKSLPLGLSLRDLPLPSMDRILACLRVAQERSPSQIYWPFEFGSLGNFTQYVVKACSPGPVTDAELIIVHYGLYWLFTECTNVAGDDITKSEYDAQALICRDSLETILSNLSFHTSTNMDSLCAMYMATIYCLQCGKPFAAWTFISRASLMSHTLGLHSGHLMAAEPADAVQQKIRLFWALYVLEKAVSLRLGKPSTIRDNDITVPRPLFDRKMTSLLHTRLPDCIDVASLYGRVYDYICSPSALAQPMTTRSSRTRALAAEFKSIMAVRAELYKRPDQWTSHVSSPEQNRFIIHINKAADYSVLASIYRGIPAEKASSLIPCLECLSAARAAIEEGKVCISMLPGVPRWSSSFDTWVNEIFLLALFTPFLILFCNIVETSDLSDLGHLKGLVDGLHSMGQLPRFATCSKRLRILKVLYNVAMTYVKARERRRSTAVPSGGTPNFNNISTHLNGDSIIGTSSPFSSFVTAPDTFSLDEIRRPLAASPTGGVENEDKQVVNQTPNFLGNEDFLATPLQMPGDFIPDLGTPGAEVGNWFHQSHQMLRLLDDL